ncbi:uncharacterized protein LOC135479287 [Liolophura sinensis]|uniref:uncharacterized protein LOC135479287 n=1 Tax=Liolophura sinensis TaxID=3198878 RepID=UPI00315819C4
MEEELTGKGLAQSEQGFVDCGRDIPGETGTEEDSTTNALFAGHLLQSSGSGTLVQNTAASPLLRRSLGDSRPESEAGTAEPMLFSPIKMLDFDEFEGTGNHSRLPGASLSKSSTPNPKSATKSGTALSPEHPVALSVGEMEASPILPEHYMESAMERELECRLMDAGRMGEESPSDRGSRERSPVIDGAEHEDTIQNRFQMMAGRPPRQDFKGKGFQRPEVVSGQSEVGSPQMYPVRMGPNHRNDGLASYKISRPSHVQGMAQNDFSSTGTRVTPTNQKPWQGHFTGFPHSQPISQGAFGGKATQQPIGSRVSGQDRSSGFLGWAQDKGGNSQQVHLRAGTSVPLAGNALFYGNENQSAQTDRNNSEASMATTSHSAVSNLKGFEFQDTAVSKFSVLVPDESHFTPQVYQDFTSAPQPSSPPMSGELPMFSHPEGKDMDEVLGHLKKVIQQGQALVGNVEHGNADGVSDLLGGQGHSSQVPRAADSNFSPRSQGSTLWFDTRGHSEPSNPVCLDDASQRIWGDNSGRYQSDPTLVAENRFLKETLEKERYRRKHCESHIQQLNSKLLEAQQQLAVVVAQSNKKDSMVEQLDKQFAQVVDGWKRKEADSEELLKKLKAEKSQMESSLQQQAAALKKFESDLAGLVEELREERETATISMDKLNTQLEEQSREMSSMFDQLSSERDRAQRMTAEWERAKEGRDLAEVKVENLQEQLHKEQDNWYRRERELLHKLDELTDSKLKAIQEERKRTEEKGALVQEVEEQLKVIVTEMDKLEKELDAAVREKESLKVEMSLNEAKHENNLKKLEADLKSDYETRISEKMTEFSVEREALEQRLTAAHRQHVEELTSQHRAEILQQTHHYEEMMKQKAELEYQEYSKKLNEIQSENTALKAKKYKLEVQRTEVLSKLQLLMQSQWNEALSILGTSSPSRPQQRTNGTAHRPVSSTSSLLSGLNLSVLSQVPSSGSSTSSTAMENFPNTPTRESILAVINKNFPSQQPSLPARNSVDELSWQHSRNRSTNNQIGPSSLPAMTSDLLNFTSQSSSMHSQERDPVRGTSSGTSQGGVQDTKSSSPSVGRSTSGPDQRSTPKHLYGDQPSNQNSSPGFTSAHYVKGKAELHLRSIPSGGDNLESREHGHSDPSVMSLSNRLQGTSLTSQNNDYPGNSRVSHDSSFQDNKVLTHDNRFTASSGASRMNRFHSNDLMSQDNRYHGSNPLSQDNGPADISLISSIHDTTTTSHQDLSFRRGPDQSNQAIAIRPPQQRSRTMQIESGQKVAQVNGRPGHSLSAEERNTMSPTGSGVIHRLRDYSEDNTSCSENQSESGFEAGPRRLEFSPPTKQPRPPWVRTSSDWSGSEEQADSVVDETLRLNEEYSEISDKLGKHESRQTELQHYIQMVGILLR